MDAKIKNVCIRNDKDIANQDIWKALSSARTYYQMKWKKLSTKRLSIERVRRKTVKQELIDQNYYPGRRAVCYKTK